MREFPPIVLASRNPKKSAEIAQLLAPHGIVVQSVAEFDDVPEVVEDGETFTAKVRRQRHPDFCGGGCAVRRDAV